MSLPERVVAAGRASAEIPLKQQHGSNTSGFGTNLPIFLQHMCTHTQIRIASERQYLRTYGPTAKLITAVKLSSLNLQAVKKS